ncbi:MAG: hypothetical protein PHY93_16645 [Bacteriovorax sp.]|nr:hypothetical protein [Bacteriovorax sp.]
MKNLFFNEVLFITTLSLEKKAIVTINTKNKIRTTRYELNVPKL